MTAGQRLERLTWEQVRAWRLHNQHLTERVPAKEMLEVVAEVCGIHAQVPSSAELQVWARVDGMRPEDVREALWEHRSLVRTWCMRGTLHLLTAADLPLYVAALRTHDRWWKGAWLRMIGFSADELRAILDAGPERDLRPPGPVAGALPRRSRDRLLQRLIRSGGRGPGRRRRRRCWQRPSRSSPLPARGR